LWKQHPVNAATRENSPGCRVDGCASSNRASIPFTHGAKELLPAGNAAEVSNIQATAPAVQSRVVLRDVGRRAAPVSGSALDAAAAGAYQAYKTAATPPSQ